MQLHEGRNADGNDIKLILVFLILLTEFFHRMDRIAVVKPHRLSILCHHYVRDRLVLGSRAASSLVLETSVRASVFLLYIFEHCGHAYLVIWPIEEG